MVGSSFKGWCRYFQYNDGTKNGDKEENRAEGRNALLVVVTLIAAVTFQAGVNPPGGVWQDNSNANNCTISGTNNGTIAGTAIFACVSSAYYVFLSSNTLAFSAAVLVMMSLTHKFPFQFEVLVAAVSMIITYGSAIFAVTPEVTKFRLVLIVAAAPLIMRCLIQLFIMLKNGKPEPPCLIQACCKPRNKTTEPPKDESLHVQT